MCGLEETDVVVVLAGQTFLRSMARLMIMYGIHAPLRRRDYHHVERKVRDLCGSPRRCKYANEPNAKRPLQLDDE